MALDPANTLIIEYADAADGRWKPVQIQPAVNGQAMIAVASGRSIDVRGMIADVAGNRGEASARIVSRSNAGQGGGTLSNTAPMKSAMPLGPSPFGTAPKSVCGKANESEKQVVQYSADYIFYKAM